MSHTLLSWSRLAVLGTFWLAGASWAQFHTVPPPSRDDSVGASSARDAREYRRDGARHLYRAYGRHIFKGKMPPLLYGIAVVETEIDERGHVMNVTMVRKPAAAEVGPWVMEMVRRAGPFPPPTMGRVRYLDVWLVHKSGRFQLDTLTEGQL